MKIATEQGKQLHKTETKWNWRKNYRVWDSNRKLFVFPENWLEPELRLPDAFRLSLDEAAVCATKRKPSRTKGVRVLFTGNNRAIALVAAGTLASELGVDLYRIDLSTVVSKFIGETEKNLEHVFNAVEDSHAILFFDEADALFGKRTEVHDSDGRYANLEVSRLLQRMEDRSGVTIVSGASKGNFERAFLRGVGFVICLPPQSKCR